MSIVVIGFTRKVTYEGLSAVTDVLFCISAGQRSVTFCNRSDDAIVFL